MLDRTNLISRSRHDTSILASRGLPTRHAQQIEWRAALLSPAISPRDAKSWKKRGSPPERDYGSESSAVSTLHRGMHGGKSCRPVETSVADLVPHARRAETLAALCRKLGRVGDRARFAK